MIRKIAFLMLCFSLAACQQQSKITLAYRNQQIIVTGVDAITLGGLKRDTLPEEAWNNLFPVKAMPADADLKDDAPPIHGKYIVGNTEISFQPDTPFQQGTTYFARYYRYDKQISYWDLIFKRRKLAQAEYVEVTFAP